MSLERFQQPVTSADELEGLIGVPSELVIKKQLSELDDHMRQFIAESPFLLLGTFGRDGSCDVSPRGDGHGVAQVLDARTLVIPDRRGNRCADSLRNILETGRVGLLFMIPGLGETLRVNGRASVIRDEELMDSLAIEGKRPIVAIAVEVGECFLQWRRPSLRSKLWEPRVGLPTTSLSSFAEILIDQTKLEGETLDSLNADRGFLQESPVLIRCFHSRPCFPRPHPRARRRSGRRAGDAPRDGWAADSLTFMTMTDSLTPRPRPHSPAARSGCRGRCWWSGCPSRRGPSRR